MPDPGILKNLTTPSTNRSRPLKRRAYDPQLRQEIGRRIGLRREQLELTQRGLAEAADLSSQRQVWAIERGYSGMTIETARRIAKALRWSLSRLFQGL